MPSVSDINPNRPEWPPHNRAVFQPLAVLFLAFLALGMSAPAFAADPIGEPIHRFSIQEGLAGLVEADGGLIILDNKSGTPLLRTTLQSLADSRRRRDADFFHRTTAEGAIGGHRGFSALADDDRDGLIDEDPLDGIDNDNDGLVDEDYAAIGDAMVAVHIKEPGGVDRSVGLEYYHWAYSHLTSAVFLSLGGNSDSTGEATYSINTSGGEWLETEIRSARHSMGGRPVKGSQTAHVSRVLLDGDSLATDPCDPSAAKWLGVMILGNNSSSRFLRDGFRLDLPFGEEDAPLVICVADSWLQLSRILSEARSVYQGMTDPVDGRRAPWIVPPACSACRSASTPAFALERGPGGEMTLTADIMPGQRGLVDPDLFAVDNRYLGPPRDIRWQPSAGKEIQIAWTCPTPEIIQSDGLHKPGMWSLFDDLVRHQAHGRLTLTFAPPTDVVVARSIADGPAPTELTGRFLDGRPLRVELGASVPPKPEVEIVVEPAVAPEPVPAMVEKMEQGYEQERKKLLEEEGQQISLSPELLIGWPNPFNDTINIRFRVPSAMQEAFVWKDNEGEKMDTDLEGDVPWSGGQPDVSVKIYSLSGQELVTLFSGTEGVGEYSAHWNGTDAFGRKVASGTYFCKLQMDDWSVTQRLVFIR